MLMIKKMIMVAILISGVGVGYASTQLAYTPWQFINMTSNQARDLQSKMDALIQSSEGSIGIGVYNLKTDQAFYFNGNKPFPMASTYKVAIATHLLQLVDKGKVNLNRMVTIHSWELVPGGSGVISEQLHAPGISLSMFNLLQLMIRKSDNTATDLLLSLSGGPSAVTASLKKLDITNMRVDRPTIDIQAEGYGVEKEINAIPVKNRDINTLNKILDSGSPEARQAAILHYQNGNLDTTTPKAMVQLLKLIATHEAMSVKNSQLLIEIMSRTETGPDRLKKLLPETVVVAHKTGSFEKTISDVGYVYDPAKPDKKIIMVVYTNGNSKKDGEEIIAKIADITYHFFQH